ncbi:MAG: class I mannose-6-phosphate isomerase [Pedococcus sp.]
MTENVTDVGVVELAPNTPQRFYRGGERILAFRGLAVPGDFDSRRPEDWLASTTELFAEGGDGLTVLPDGRRLVDALEEDPTGWLGEAHLARHGASPGLLVKLLDAGERLPVHSHPDREFAARHLDCAHGKTEAWLVVAAEPGAQVWVGFHDDVDVTDLAELVEAQDERLLALLNGFEVQRGDAILVPAGQPHAIGAGVLVVELQEPTDFSVMLEHERFGLDADHAWLGLTQQVALESVAMTALAADDIAALRMRWLGGSGVRSALPAQASEYFTADVVDTREVSAQLDAGFSVLVVVDGAGSLRSAHHDPVPLAVGQTFVIPHAVGDLVIDGAVTALRCSPSREPGPVRA